MPLTAISLKLTPELLERLRAVAKERRTTVTELLLGPWRDGEPAEANPMPMPQLGRSKTVVVPAKRSRTVATPQPKGRLVGFAPDGSEIRR